MGGDGFFPSLGEKVEGFFLFGKEGLSDFRVGTGFIAHHEKEGSGVGDGMGGGIVREFCHGEEFGPFRRLVLGEDTEEGFKFLINPFRFAIGLGVIGGGEGNVVIKKVGEFSCKGGGELGSMVRDDPVV